MQTEKVAGSVSVVVKNIASPIAQQLGFDLWDVKFLKEGPNWYLRVFIDKSEGVSLDDCERMSKALDEPLDKLDPIEQSYFLEVCSPGIERELSVDEHFKRYIGSNVLVKLIRPWKNGEKVLSGQLLSFENEKIAIKTEKNTEIISKKDAAHVNLDENQGRNQ